MNSQAFSSVAQILSSGLQTKNRLASGEVDELWARSSSRNLPMVRATLRPKSLMTHMNSALLRLLGYETIDMERMLGIPLERFLPECGVLFSGNLWTNGFMYRSFTWERSDGGRVAITMLFLASVDGNGNEELIGVGSPRTTETKPGLRFAHSMN